LPIGVAGTLYFRQQRAAGNHGVGTRLTHASDGCGEVVTADLGLLDQLIELRAGEARPPTQGVAFGAGVVR
jgi:hypothetical protein